MKSIISIWRGNRRKPAQLEVYYKGRLIEAADVATIRKDLNGTTITIPNIVTQLGTGDAS